MKPEEITDQAWSLTVWVSLIVSAMLIILALL